MDKGKFIVFEGADGCGKTTQIERAQGFIHGLAGAVPPIYQAMGSGVNGKELRKFLRGNTGWDFKSEVALMAVAIRGTALELQPILEGGGDVICDRWTMSTLAYQVWGRAAGISSALSEAEYLLDVLVPALNPVYIVLNAPYEMRAARMDKRGGPGDVFDSDVELQKRLGRAYDVLAGLAAFKAHRVSAAGTVDETWAEVKLALEKIYGEDNN